MTEERTVVSVLFCDLVGFTTASESADPEDVRRWLAPYHSTLRQTVERYGASHRRTSSGSADSDAVVKPTRSQNNTETTFRSSVIAVPARSIRSGSGLGL